MDVLCVIQARTGSSRLPGKVLADVAGQPMLGFMLDRLRPLLGDYAIVVATSTERRDDAVEELAERSGVPTVRGSERDVLDRFRQAVADHSAGTVVRLTADCPLADPDVIRSAIRLHDAQQADYTSNTLIRTYPVGLDVEVLRSEALLAAAAEATDPLEREHVTPFVYRHPERFRLRALRTSPSFAEERWTVDTRDDLEFIRSVVARVPDHRAGWAEIFDRVGRRHPLPAGGLKVRYPTDADSPMVAEKVRLLDDPSSRTWLVERDGQLEGWLRVAVTAGVGLLNLDLPVADRGDAVGLVQRALASDLQVQELHTSDSTTGELLAGVGFRFQDGWWRWVR